MTLVRYLATSAFATTLVILGATHAQAQAQGTPAEAKAMSEKAAAHVKSVGKEKAFEDFNSTNSGWQDRDLYVFAFDMQGNVLAHGANKALIGKNLIGLKDPNGKEFIVEFGKVATSKGSGWVDYHFSHPQTKKVLPKASYIMKFPDGAGYVGVGAYK